MTHILLCAGPTLLVIEKDGLLYFHQPGQPDTRVPYSVEHYPIFFRSAKGKYDLTRVLGPGGEDAPALAAETDVPNLCLIRLPSGETVYRIVAEALSPNQQPEAHRLEP